VESGGCGDPVACRQASVAGFDARGSQSDAPGLRGDPLQVRAGLLVETGVDRLLGEFEGDGRVRRDVRGEVRGALDERVLVEAVVDEADGGGLGGGDRLAGEDHVPGDARADDIGPALGGATPRRMPMVTSGSPA